MSEVKDEEWDEILGHVDYSPCQGDLKNASETLGELLKSPAVKAYVAKMRAKNSPVVTRPPGPLSPWVDWQIDAKCTGKKGDEIVLQAGPFKGVFRLQKIVPSDTYGFEVEKWHGHGSDLRGHGTDLRVEIAGKPQKKFYRTRMLDNPLGSGFYCDTLLPGLPMVVRVRFFADCDFNGHFFGVMDASEYGGYRGIDEFVEVSRRKLFDGEE